jgi:2-hydroxycyclohexanecarboxyl-CoA dehydrogenase
LTTVRPNGESHPVERRVAIVTGAGRGIGRATSLALAGRGARVLGVARSEDELEALAREAPVEVLAESVATEEGCERIVEEARRRLGPVEILVNNAGWDEMRPFIETDEPFWDRVIEVNFKGGLRLTRAVLPGMVERGYGRIVNIGSDAGRVGSSLESVYSGAKGGVIAFTKTIAREVARRGVTANTVCPGPTDTEMLREVTGGDEGAKVIEAMTRAVPMKRLGTPADVAAAVVFLASDEAGFITGQTLSVSGGLTMA